VTAAELAVLEVLWERGCASRRQIADVLYPGGAPAHYTTVQKLLERLEEKKLVERQQQEGTWVFTATIDRDELISRRLRSVADQLCGGSLTPLLMNLVRSGPLSAAQLQELQELIGRLERQRRPRDKR
jgi:predicted transcriptional regulator